MKRINIDLPEKTIKQLQKIAKKHGRKLKPLLERILILTAENKLYSKPEDNL